MASPSTVITEGFGSFGSVNLLPTLGYGQGDTPTTTPCTFIGIWADDSATGIWANDSVTGIWQE